MLTLTTETASQLRSSSAASGGPHGADTQRTELVALGSGLCASIPAGPGRASTRWHQRAEEILQQLRGLLSQHGTALEYRWVDELIPGGAMRWIAIRVVADKLPAECLLTHPKIASVLLEALEIALGCRPAVYYRDGQLRACAARDAHVVPEWVGPLDLSAGYCMSLPLR